MNIYGCMPGCGGGCCPRCAVQITHPTQLEQLESLEQIKGVARPCQAVCICIGDNPPLQTSADACGQFCVANPYPLADGPHRICARGCCGDCCHCVDIYIEGSAFMAEAVAARMGRTFRTVDIDVLMWGTTGTALVYYLLLPPGSPAPTAEEIMHYPNAPALLDGSAAAGQFTAVVNPAPTTHTWALTGLNMPNAPLGTTGVVDGYRYDVYIYVVSGGRNSGVLAFPETAVMGMPFATGLGTHDDPFTIRELGPDELALYPDLLEGNPLNLPGVDENARQLENIERLVTLYERTDGYYGLGDSMALHYLMSSDIDLANYAAAYDGAGWEAIGDIDGWINDTKETEHLFSGVFDGGNHTIENLSITPVATDDYFVGYRGLFGGVEYGTIENLRLQNVTIDAFTTTPGFAQLGAFISTSRNPTLRALSLDGADITADCDTVPVGDTHQINIGGFVGAIFDGASVSDISGQNISIVVPSLHALALGGFVGYTDKFTARDSYERISLRGLFISGYGMVGGFAGYLVYGANLLKDISIDNATLIAPGGQAGGLVGLNYIYDAGGDELVEGCTVSNISISASGGEGSGNDVGGLIGLIARNDFPPAGPNIPNRVFGERETAGANALAASPVTTIRLCSVLGNQIHCASNGGGLVGRFYVYDMPQNGIVTGCKAEVAVSGTGANIGGLIGSGRQLTISQSFATGAVFAAQGTAGGLVGSAEGGFVWDSYATGQANGMPSAGGLVGELSQVTLSRCYRSGDVNAVLFAGGIAGVGENASIQNSLVLVGNMQAAVAHRVLGAENGNMTLQSNFATDAVTPVPGAPDPNGLDGGTITSGEIAATMQALGWDTVSVWNAASIPAFGRPTLLQNPE